MSDVGRVLDSPWDFSGIQFPLTVRVPHLCTPEQLYSSIANHHDDLAITGNTLDERNWVLCENKCGPTKRASLRIDLGGGDPLVLDKVFLAARLARIGSSLNFADQPDNWIKLKKRQKPYNSSRSHNNNSSNHNNTFSSTTSTNYNKHNTSTY